VTVQQTEQHNNKMHGASDECVTQEKNSLIQEQQHIAVGPGNAQFILFARCRPTLHVQPATVAAAAATAVRQFTE